METQIKKNLPPGYEDLFEEEGADLQIILRRARKHVFRYRDTKKQVKFFLKKDILQHSQNLKELDLLIKKLKQLKKDRGLVSLKKVERKNLRDYIFIQKYRVKALEEAFDYCIREHKQVVALLTDQDVSENELDELNYIG